MDENTIRKAIDKLRKRKKIFQSEAELKCGLATEIEKLSPKCIVWHEYPAKSIWIDKSANSYNNR